MAKDDRAIAEPRCEIAGQHEHGRSYIARRKNGAVPNGQPRQDDAAATRRRRGAAARGAAVTPAAPGNFTKRVNVAR